jgi:hypothetical protein
LFRKLIARNLLISIFEEDSVATIAALGHVVRETRNNHAGEALHAGKPVTNPGELLCCHQISFFAFRRLRRSCRRQAIMSISTTVSKIAQTLTITRSYCFGMDRNLYDSLEAIANLLYLVRSSLHDPIAASRYAVLAEEKIGKIRFLLNDVIPRPDFGDNLPFS